MNGSSNPNLIWTQVMEFLKLLITNWGFAAVIGALLLAPFVLTLIFLKIYSRDIITTNDNINKMMSSLAVLVPELQLTLSMNRELFSFYVVPLKHAKIKIRSINQSINQLAKLISIAENNEIDKSVIDSHIRMLKYELDDVKNLLDISDANGENNNSRKQEEMQKILKETDGLAGRLEELEQTYLEYLDRKSKRQDGRYYG